MTFGITVNRATLQNAPVYELFEARCQKITRDSNLLLKIIKSANTAECFP